MVSPSGKVSFGPGWRVDASRAAQAVNGCIPDRGALYENYAAIAVP